MLDPQLKKDIIKLSFISALLYMAISGSAVWLYLEERYESGNQISQMLFNSVSPQINAKDFRAAIKVLNEARNFNFSTVRYEQNATEIFRLDYSKGHIFGLSPSFRYEHRIQNYIGDKSPSSKLVMTEDLGSALKNIILFLATGLLLLIYVIQFFAKRIIKNYEVTLALDTAQKMSTLSTQLAHDIRSPLATLDAIYDDLDTLPANSKKLIQSSIARIHGIAEGLLTKARNNQFDQIELSVFSPHETILEIIEEKGYQFRQNENLTIKPKLNSYSTMIEGNKLELMRIISNLINNSAEALNGNGEIEIVSSTKGDHYSIEIRDNGPGIPQSIIDRLGERGATEGKANGNGLGLYHAYCTIKEWGGEFSVLSSKDGTTIVLNLPLIEQQLNNKIDMALLDNDPLVRMNWKLLAQKNGINLVIFENSSKLFDCLNQLHKDTPIYLDDDLGEEKNGVELAAILSDKGYRNLHLCTGHPPDRFEKVPFLQSIEGKSFPLGAKKLTLPEN